MSERDDTIALANRVLDRPYADPDDDLAMLSRQFLRALEAIASARNEGFEAAREQAAKRLEERAREIELTARQTAVLEPLKEMFKCAAVTLIESAAETRAMRPEEKT